VDQDEKDPPRTASYVASLLLSFARLSSPTHLLSLPQLPSARPTVSPRASAMNMGPTFTGPPTRPTFGVDLGEQMMRDGVEVPRVLEKCCEAIERHGLDSMGIYRLSGTTSRVQRLKSYLDRGEVVALRV
jgi:hypothetical protein